MGGRLAGTPDGGRLVLFDGPATALRAASEQLAGAPNLRIRLGLHIAEVPLSTGLLDGPAIRRCVALADQAAEHELITSSVVRDLVAGSGLELEALELPDPHTGERQG